MVARRDERIARFALGSANPGGRLKSGDDAPAWVETVALGDIDPDPEQPRRHFDPDKLRELADSLLAVGQLQPIILIRTDSRYRLHVGERRWRAAGLAGLASIRAIVRATPLEARAARIAQIVENEQRDDLTTTELIDAVRALHADGLKSVQIAAALSKPKSRISELSALADAPAQLIAVADVIGQGLAYQLLLRWRDHPAAALDFLAHMPPEHISRITIATIGEPAVRPLPDRAAPGMGSAAPDVAPDRLEAGKGAPPRDPVAPPRPAIESRSDISPHDEPAAAPLVPATTGALLIEHDVHGRGLVVFGVDAPADHLAVSFGGAAPIVLHKADIRLLRTVAATDGPA